MGSFEDKTSIVRRSSSSHSVEPCGVWENTPLAKTLFFPFFRFASSSETSIARRTIMEEAKKNIYVLADASNYRFPSFLTANEAAKAFS